MQIDEAHAKLNLVQDFIPAGNSNRPGTRLAPSFITIHNTDNTSPGANAAAHARYQKGADARRRKVSWHFTVDDGVVYQSVPTNEVAWHANAGNASSIGIEICMHPEMQVEAAYSRAALLVALLARRSGIAVPGGIVQHHRWSGKHCPRVLRDAPSGWQRFLDSVSALHATLEDVRAPDIADGHHDHDHDDDAGDDGDTASPQSPVDAPWQPDHAVTAKKGLRLRAGPGTAFDVLSTLSLGARVRALSRSGDWVMVQIDPGPGSDGFVHGAFLAML